jgi:hypothetical protein
MHAPVHEADLARLTTHLLADLIEAPDPAWAFEMAISSHTDLALTAAVLPADRCFGAAQPFPAFFVFLATLSFAHHPPSGTIRGVWPAPAVVGHRIVFSSRVNIPSGALVVRAAAKANEAEAKDCRQKGSDR